MTLPIPSVHGNEVVEASVVELLQCQLEVHDLVQFTPVATGLMIQVTIGYSQLSAG